MLDKLIQYTTCWNFSPMFALTWSSQACLIQTNTEFPPARADPGVNIDHSDLPFYSGTANMSGQFSLAESSRLLQN